MSAGIEVSVADAFIYGKLAADAQLTALVSTRLYSDQIPQGATKPLVLFGLLSGLDKRVMGAGRLWSDLVYQVVGMAEAESYGGNLKTMAQRIDAVLHASSGATADGTVFACVREGPLRLVEILPGGGQVRRLGGRYRVYAQ